MKKLRLRKWAKAVLGIISVLAFMVMASECESTLWFIIGHLIACGVFTLSTMTLIRYGE